jgi:hypothetical protein
MCFNLKKCHNILNELTPSLGVAGRYVVLKVGLRPVFEEYFY